ncbi:MAG: hypothetical protein DRP01_02035 [Archaeoglobales archaeon]|nr:MAG: hypothetical protein DRP01_02035 [Archaeoglobales archaeon]
MASEAPRESEGKQAVQKFLGMMTPAGMTQTPQASHPPQEEGGNAKEVSEEPQTEMADDLEQRLVEQIRNIDAAPELSYEQRLSRLGVGLEEAAKIVDTILSQGHYEREFTIGRRHSVTFRTRGVEDQERLQESIENQVPRYALTVNEMTARHNIAGSLAEFGGKRYTADEFKKAYAATGKMSLAVFNALVERLARFDRIMYTVLSEGAVENF